MFAQLDYENISKAAYRISNVNTQQSKEGLKTEILQIISEQLNFHHLIFWEVRENELNNAPVLFNVNEQTVEKYLSTYKHFDPLHPINMQKQPSLQLLDKNKNIEPIKSDYYKSIFLEENNFKDEMVMYLKYKGKPCAAIGFLRSHEEPNFTQRDILTLYNIKQCIGNSYLLNQYFKPNNSDVTTPREEEILQCVCKGFTNIEIAQNLFVSENTVKKHLQNLYRKFHVTSRTQLVMAYMQGKWDRDY